MKYLGAQDILVIHAFVIDGTGGAHGVRDVGLLQSAAERPKMRFGGKELYKGVFAKAAACFESLAKHHVFVDGNKRTAVTSAARFLAINGIELIASNGELEIFTLRVVEEKLEIEAIAAWLKSHSKKER